MQEEADTIDRKVRERNRTEFESGASINKRMSGISAGAGLSGKNSKETETIYQTNKEKVAHLDQWLPELKHLLRDFFDNSSSVKYIFLQVDDLYHLRRTDQAFVVDYVHRLCKDIPIYFKIATLRHASTLYADRDGQPIGAQERHDYQPIHIDYTFSDFNKTEKQNWEILKKFADRVSVSEVDLKALFKGQGFSRLVMAGGGVPRDVLSLFLEVLSQIDHENGDQIGKDEVRILSKSNFERRIEELKQDSQDDEQDELLRGIYTLRTFCLQKQTNIFVVEERLLQNNDRIKNLFYRLLDYRIIHSCGSALTHKSQEGNYHAFAIDIGCYAHLRKLQGKFRETDVSENNAKERMRSAPVIDEETLTRLFDQSPENIEEVLLSEDD